MVEESPEWEGFKNSATELAEMLDEYYALHRWNPVTGRPTAATLRGLGLAEIGSELAIVDK
jgi:aldehyde:ferredoxin oxidoreductase